MKSVEGAAKDESFDCVLLWLAFFLA